MLLCVKANRMRASLPVDGTQLSEPRPSGPAASAAMRESVPQSLIRKPKHRFIAIGDAAPKAASPAAIVLTQSGAIGEQKIGIEESDEV